MRNQPAIHITYLSPRIVFQKLCEKPTYQDQEKYTLYTHPVYYKGCVYKIVKPYFQYNLVIDLFNLIFVVITFLFGSDYENAQKRQEDPNCVHSKLYCIMFVKSTIFSTAAGLS